MEASRCLFRHFLCPNAEPAITAPVNLLCLQVYVFKQLLAVLVVYFGPVDLDTARRTLS
jgi:hypothetical protein